MSKNSDIISDAEITIAHLRALNEKLQDKVNSLEEKVEDQEAYLDFYSEEDPDEKYSELLTEYKEALIEIVTLLLKKEYREAEVVTRNHLMQFNYFYSDSQGENDGRHC